MLHDRRNSASRTYEQMQEERERYLKMRGRQKRTAAIPQPAFGRKPLMTSGDDPAQPTFFPTTRRRIFNTSSEEMSRNCKNIVINLSLYLTSRLVFCC